MGGLLWTDREIKLLESKYGKISTVQISQLLKRKPQAIRSKAKKLKLGFQNRWVSEDDIFLRNNYYKMSSKQIAIRLGKKLGSVYYRANKLHLHKTIESIGRIRNLQINLSKVEKAYLAGLIDGDGTIGLKAQKVKNNKRSLTPYLSISNSNPKIISWLREKIPQVGIYEHRRRIKNKEQWKLVWIFQTWGRRIKTLIEAILPYLHGKREEATLILGWIESRSHALIRSKYSKEDWDIYYKIQEMHGHKSLGEIKREETRVYQIENSM